MMDIRKLIKEQVENVFNQTFFHGTRTKFPFKKFDKNLEGTGIVSSGRKEYGGFFFTSEMENAEFYSEYFVAEVIIKNIKEDPTNSNHPQSILNKASEDNLVYIARNVHDGSIVSNVVVVPHSMLNNVHVVKWHFVGDKEVMFEELDEFFGGDMNPDDEESYDDGNLMEPYIDQMMIDSFVRMVGGEISFILKNPVFKEYYDSKI